jgi:hypothetical protein
VGDFRFVVTPSLEMSHVLNRSVRRYVLNVIGIVKFLSPKLGRK